MPPDRPENLSAEGSIGIQAVGAKGGVTGTIVIELKLKG